MRKKIFDILNLLYPTYAIGQHENDCVSPYLVLKFNTQDKSLGSELGGWQTLEVMVYIPDSSISPMEDILGQVKEALKSILEVTSNVTPDFKDTTVHAYMRSIQFRQPKGL